MLDLRESFPGHAEGYGVVQQMVAGLLTRAPRIHTVQTRGAAPLQRAWARLQERRDGANAEDALRYAAAHRSSFMWPWEEAPHSIAEGIVDDETYDWLALLRGMAVTGGTTVIADEAAKAAANRTQRYQEMLMTVMVRPSPSASPR